MNTRYLLCSFLMSVALPGVISAQESTAPPAAQASDVIKVASKDEAAVLAAKGKKVAMTGVVIRTKKLDSGISFINLEGNFPIVCFEKDYAAFKAGHPADIYTGKQIEITGEISEFKGKLQIKLTSPDQVKILGDAPKDGSKTGMKEDKKGEKGEKAEDKGKDDEKGERRGRKERPSKEKDASAVPSGPYFGE